MIGNLRPASDSEIERLLAHPAEITRFLYGAGSDGRERVVLSKAWHAIHYVLTGSRLDGDEPLNFLVDEGTPVGEVDVGYGPARVLTSEQVRRIAAALAPISPEEVARRVDVAQFDREAIYPGHWQRNGIGVDDVVSNYRDMRDLIVRLAEQGQGVVLYINWLSAVSRQLSAISTQLSWCSWVRVILSAAKDPRLRRRSRAADPSSFLLRMTRNA